MFTPWIVIVSLVVVNFLIDDTYAKSKSKCTSSWNICKDKCKLLTCSKPYEEQPAGCDEECKEKACVCKGKKLYDETIGLCVLPKKCANKQKSKNKKGNKGGKPPKSTPDINEWEYNLSPPNSQVSMYQIGGGNENL